MSRLFSLLALSVLALSACAPQQPSTAGPAAGAVQPTEQRDEAQVLRIGTALFGAHPGPDATLGLFYFQLPAFDTLTRFGEGFDIQPSVATRWELSSDQREWRFTVRDNLTFSNGDKLTADDVAFSINTSLAEKWPQFAYLSAVTGATAVNPTTVSVTTSQLDVTVPTGMIYQWVIPKRYYEQVGPQQFRQRPVGSGPYEFVEFRPDESLRYRKRATLHPFRPVANSEIVYSYVPENQQRINGLNTGILDLAAQSNFSGDQAERLKRDGFDVRTRLNSTLLFAIPQGTYELRGTPLANVKVRQALNYAINRDLINQTVYKGFGQPTGQLSIPGSQYWDDSAKAWPYDVARAKQLLAEAGYANGFKVAVNWSGSSGPQEVILLVQSQLKEIRVEAEIKTVEASQTADYHLGRNGLVKEDLFPLNGGDSTGFGPFSYIGCGKPVTNPASALYYCNPEHDKLAAAALAEPDPAKRKALLLQAARISINDAPAIFVTLFPVFIVGSKNIRGLETTKWRQYNFDSVYKVK